MSLFSSRGVRLASVFIGLFLCVTRSQGQVVSVTDFGSIGRSVQRSTITEYNGNLIFAVGIDDTHDREIWSFNGNESKRIASGFIGDSEIALDEFTEFQGRLYFSANTGAVGNELYRYDGNSVSLAVDLETGAESSFPVNLVTHNGALYFSAKQGESFNSLWKYDGSEAFQIAKFDDPRARVVTGATFQGDLYFGADDSQNGMELYRYDGNNVELVADVNPGAGDSYPRDFAVVGDNLYFKATSTSGQEVWRFDGEEASILDDTNPGPESSDPRHLTEVNGELLFSAVKNRVRRVFVSDGESVEPIVNGGGPIQVGNNFYTIRGRRERGVEINDLYNLDGTFHRSTVPSAGPFVNFNDSLFFSCSCSDRELYMIADAGDTDSDGAVTFVDFLSLAKNYGGDGGWKNGDSNGDGQVEFDDFLAQAENFGGAPIKKSQTASVPEPNTSVLLAVGLIGCLFQLRKQVRA